MRERGAGRCVRAGPRRFWWGRTRRGAMGPSLPAGSPPWPCSAARVHAARVVQRTWFKRNVSSARQAACARAMGSAPPASHAPRRVRPPTIWAGPACGRTAAELPPWTLVARRDPLVVGWRPSCRRECWHCDRAPLVAGCRPSCRRGCWHRDGHAGGKACADRNAGPTRAFGARPRGGAVGRRRGGAHGARAGGFFWHSRHCSCSMSSASPRTCAREPPSTAMGGSPPEARAPRSRPGDAPSRVFSAPRPPDRAGVAISSGG